MTGKSDEDARNLASLVNRLTAERDALIAERNQAIVLALLYRCSDIRSSKNMNDIVRDIAMDIGRMKLERLRAEPEQQLIRSMMVEWLQTEHGQQLIRSMMVELGRDVSPDAPEADS